jgi:oligosaccharide repeat unit polymerase
MVNTAVMSPALQFQRKQLALAFNAGVFFLLLIAPAIYKASGLQPGALLYSASVVLTLLFGFQLWCWGKLSVTRFDPYVMFSCGAMLFNGSRALLEVFHLNADGGMLGPQISPETALATVYLVTLGMWAFHMGGTLGSSTNKAAVHRVALPPSAYENMRMVGWMLIAIAAVPSFIILREAIVSVLSYGYFVALFQKEAATSIHATPELLAALLVPGAFLVTAASKERRIQLGVSAALVGIYVITQLALGSRSVAGAALLPYVWLWHRCIKPVPKIPVVVGGAILVFLIAPLIGVSRQFTGSNRYSPAELLQALYSIDNPAVSVLSEMGGTASTLAHTVDLVPDSKPYDVGSSYAYGVLTLIPNLFWDIHPTIAHGTPNMWLAWTINPYIAARGGGFGYSFLAEGYYNAGWLGVVLASALLGFAFARLSVWVSGADELAKIACGAIILAFTLKYIRSDCSEVIRGTVWYALLPYGMVRLMGRKAGRALRYAPNQGLAVNR